MGRRRVDTRAIERASIRRWRIFQLLAIGLLPIACSSQVWIGEAVANGEGTRIDLGLNACGGTYEVEYGESEDEVAVLVTDARSPISFGGNDCQDRFNIDLEAPLGDRVLTDVSRNVEIEVLYEPWNKAAYSEARYREALEAAQSCALDADPDVVSEIVETPDGPRLEMTLGDVPDGERRTVDPTYDCYQQHVEPLRH
jgi:hypothetical protein